MRDELGTRAGAGVPRLGTDAGRRGERRSGASRRHPRRPRRRGEGAVPGRRRRDRGRPRQRRGAVPAVQRVRAEGPRHEGARRRAARRGCATSSTTASRPRNVDEFRTPLRRPSVRPHARASSPSTSARRVLTTEWVDGLSWNEFREQRRRRQHGAAPARASGASPSTRSTASACSTATRIPGNYRFTADGDVTFLDFGLVKRWSPGEWELLAPSMDAIIVHRDPERLVATMEAIGFLARRPRPRSPQAVYDYVSSAVPAVPRPTRSRSPATFMRDTHADGSSTSTGPHAEVIEQLNMPASFVILDRVVWGISALLGKLELTAPWRAMLLEYRVDGDPATPLGWQELAWRRARRATARPDAVTIAGRSADRAVGMIAVRNDRCASQGASWPIRTSREHRSLRGTAASCPGCSTSRSRRAGSATTSGPR